MDWLAAHFKFLGLPGQNWMLVTLATIFGIDRSFEVV
jgi:hypothetical protein